MALALAARLAWSVSRPGPLDERLPDQREYLESAHNLLHGRGLCFYDARFEQNVHAYRGPGYPLFVAACRASPMVVRLAQAAIDSLTVLAVYLLARRWMTFGPALLAAALMAFNPYMIYMSSLILGETLFIAMLTWGLVLLAHRRNYLWGGAVLALSVLVRPSAVMLPPLLGIATSYMRMRTESRPARPTSDGDDLRVRFRDRPATRSMWLRLPGALMVLLTLAALLPWMLRNRAVVGSPVWLTTNAGITRYDGFNAGATGASNQAVLSKADCRRLAAFGEVQRDKILSNWANRYIQQTMRDEPLHLLRLTASKIARTWSPMPLGEFRSPLHVAAALAYSVPVDLLILAGLLRRTLRWPVKMLLLAPAIYFTIVHALSVGSIRYRLPAEPALLVLAASAVIARISPGSPREAQTA